MSIYNSLIFTEALEQVELILLTENTDEIADRLEKIAPNPDLAMSCLMLLVIKAKGGDISGMTGVEIANLQPTVKDLILPPGVYM